MLQTNYFILPENCIPWRGARHCGRSSEDCYRRRPLKMLHLRSLVNFLILCDSPNLAHCHLFIHHLTSDRETCKIMATYVPSFLIVSCLSSEHAAEPARSRRTSESCFKTSGNSVLRGARYVRYGIKVKNGISGAVPDRGVGYGRGRFSEQLLRCNLQGREMSSEITYLARPPKSS